MVDQGLRPIVLLLNNCGLWHARGDRRPLRLLRQAPWDYPAMARAWGVADRATTAAELQPRCAAPRPRPAHALIEAVTARDDLSPVMGGFATMSARQVKP